MGRSVMSANLKLEADRRGQIDRGSEQVFRGRNMDDDLVHLHIASDEWQAVLTAHSSRESALHALETLSYHAEWSRNEADGGWTVRLLLPKS
jgi:hypothetical protein